MDADARVIRAAIETEIDGYRFFLDCSQQAAVPKVQPVWLDLARDELEHMRILQGHLSSLSQSGDWGPLADEGDAELPHRAPITAAREPAAPTPFGSDVEALREGLKVEESTCRFYADAAERTSSAVGRRTYRQLAGMEMGHYRLIEETIAMLADPAQWLFLQARPVQEG